ncbi:hypothetical protein E4U51_001563 [Claviceps purpurea]|nr:hypothetical protein E4U51_001563 [Claviceps purpurea]
MVFSSVQDHRCSKVQKRDNCMVKMCCSTLRYPAVISPGGSRQAGRSNLSKDFPAGQQLAALMSSRQLPQPKSMIHSWAKPFQKDTHYINFTHEYTPSIFDGSHLAHTRNQVEVRLTSAWR